ncbi:MAG: amino acid adenylation domain-containing protein, partial [Gemmatimonadota bacterium]
LGRCAGEEDVVFGATVSGRPAELAGAEETVGLFINTLPVRVRLRPEAEVGAWLGRLQGEQVEAREHGYAPLAEVQKWSGVPAGEALFESLVAYENYPVDRALEEQAGRLGGLRVRSSFGHEQTNYPVVLIAELLDSLHVELRYDGARVEEGAAERMAEHLQVVLEALASGTARLLSAVPLLREPERRRVLEEWNDTAAGYPPACVHELFSAQAARTPDAAAVEFCGRELTYAQLERTTNQLACHLRGLGVGPEVRVGVCAERSLEMVVGVLGVLKAGGAYAPLDPAYPAERLRSLLRDAGAPVLLTQARLAGRVEGYRGAVVCLDADAGAIALEPDGPVDGGAGPRSAAYVIYTSGSTGTPKGVVVEHGSLANYLQFFTREVLRGDGFALPLVSRLGFDAHVRQLFPPLLRGDAVWVLPDEAASDPAALLELLASKPRVSFGGVPSLWSAVLERVEAGEGPAPEGLAAVLLGGEALPAELVRRTRARFPGVAVWNHYGPTEATVNTTAGRVEGAERVTLGRPVSNARLYVLDAWGAPLPVGVAGELYVGGAGVARGYLGRPELTAERFVPDPFGRGAGARLYRTGDRVRWLDTGDLEYLGRVDAQVKVRGFRIEPGEVEAALREQPGVREAAVLLREDSPGQRRLVAYVAPEAGVEVSWAGLRAGLSERLPDYMVPDACMVLERLPLNANGKVDRRALPEPEGGPGRADYVPPRTAMEEVLCAIWGEVLGIERVSAEDDFFELGGHSLLAMQAVTRVRQTTGVDLSLRTFFEVRILAGVARAVEDQLLLAIDLPDAERHLDELENESEAGRGQLAQEPADAPLSPNPVGR